MDEKANLDTDLSNTFVESAIPYCLQYFLGIQDEEDCYDDDAYDEGEDRHTRKKSGGKQKHSDDWLIIFLFLKSLYAE